jgi:hypothetical protein
VISEGLPKLEAAAVDLLLQITETPTAAIAGEVLDGFFDASAATALIRSGLLEPAGHVPATASQADDDDEPIHLHWSEEHGGYGYFSACAGWVTVQPERLARFTVNWLVLLSRLTAHLDVASRGPTMLIPEVLWEIGDARIGHRPQRTPIWFARRLGDQVGWKQIVGLIERRPTTQLRVLLTSTPAALVPDQAPPGHLIVPVSDALDFAAGLAISPDVIAALLGNPRPADVRGRVYLSPDGRQLVINGNIELAFRSDRQIAIVRRLVQGFKEGRRFSARDLLDHAQSSAKTLRQAFGTHRWTELEPHLKSENGLWGLAP